METRLTVDTCHGTNNFHAICVWQLLFSLQTLSISRSLINVRIAVLNNSNSVGERIKDQIVQTLTEAGGQVDYVEVRLKPSFIQVPLLFSIKQFIYSLSSLIYH